MKSFFIIIFSLLLFCLPINAQEGWQKYLRVSSSRLEDIQFIDENHGTVVGLNGTIVKTNDGGETWNAQYSGTTYALSSVCYVDTNIGTIVGSMGTILRTTDGGANWVNQSIVDTMSLQTVYFSDENIGTAVGWVLENFQSKALILRTTDGGENWNIQNQLSGTGSDPALFGVYFKNTNEGIAVGSYGMVLTTTDGGQNWIYHFHGLYYNYKGLYFLDENNGWAVGHYTASNGLLRKTTNMGITWQTQIFGTPGNPGPLNDVYFSDVNYGTAIGQGRTLRTTNGGANWITILTGTLDDFTGVYFTDENKGWMIDNYGWLYRTTNGGVSYIENEVNNSIEFQLSQNYPNPFNPSTNIKYQLPEFGFVTLKVYDILGREVATLVNEEKPAGEYEIEFDGTGLTNGIYFYQLKAGDFVETKKMVLIR
ncbi:MAG: T9SS type A sorting domain-containing protein [bacterium]|nr:T9SS type A sorting domain-containing protein [bacterium]